jgi:hypothetical protein
MATGEFARRIILGPWADLAGICFVNEIGYELVLCVDFNILQQEPNNSNE